MPGCYKKVFASFYDPFMRSTERGLYKKRKALISPLRGRVLEVGSGTGINYQFYGAGVQLLALDPNAHMLARAKAKAPRHLNITYLHHGIGDPEIGSIIRPNSLDAVVSTLVLCSVPHPELALARFKQWLKPAGKLIVLEHIQAQNPVNKRLQNLINPIWRPLADGCNLNRNTDRILLAAGFEAHDQTYFVQSLRWVMGVYTPTNNN